MNNFNKLNTKIKEEFRNEQDIEWFLTHRCMWSSRLSLDDKMEIINSVSCLEESLRELSYEEFMRSSYWDAVREYLLTNMSFGCSLCGDEMNRLKLFRKSTYYYGKEWLPHARYDFLVLCPKCYEKMTKYFPEITQTVEHNIQNIIQNYQRPTSNETH